MVDELLLSHYGHEDALAIQQQLVDIYLEVHAGDGPFYSRERYLRQLQGHMKVPGWSLIVAAIAGAPVGYIYGFPLPPRTRWWEGMQTPVPEDFTSEDGRRTFALSELMVRPGWRRRGFAKTLHDELIGSRTEQRMTLLVRPDNAIAHAAYAKWGYRKEGELRPAWEHAPFFDVLVLERAR